MEKSPKTAELNRIAHFIVEKGFCAKITVTPDVPLIQGCEQVIEKSKDSQKITPNEEFYDW